jgi:hypothetical protein
MPAKPSAGGPKLAGNSWHTGVRRGSDVISSAPTWGRNAEIARTSARSPTGKARKGAENWGHATVLKRGEPPVANSTRSTGRLALATAQVPTASDRRRHSRASAMAARCVGIANAALKAGRAPRRRGRAPSVTEAAAVLAEQAVAVI